jgi:hypothetical protein
MTTLGAICFAFAIAGILAYILIPRKETPSEPK